MVEKLGRNCMREKGKLYHAWETSWPKIPVSTLSRGLSDWMTFIICLFLVLLILLLLCLLLLSFPLLFLLFFLFSVVRGGVEG